MKKTFYFLALNFLALSGFAQHNYGNQNMLYSNANAVTVGSSSQIAGYVEPDSRGFEIYSPVYSMLTLKTGSNAIQLTNSPLYGHHLYLPTNQPFTFLMGGASNPTLRINIINMFYRSKLR